jgi:hypothetical protein
MQTLRVRMCTQLGDTSARWRSKGPHQRDGAIRCLWLHNGGAHVSATTTQRAAHVRAAQQCSVLRTQLDAAAAVAADCQRPLAAERDGEAAAVERQQEGHSARGGHGIGGWGCDPGRWAGQRRRAPLAGSRRRRRSRRASDRHGWRRLLHLGCGRRRRGKLQHRRRQRRGFDARGGAQRCCGAHAGARTAGCGLRGHIVEVDLRIRASARKLGVGLSSPLPPHTLSAAFAPSLAQFARHRCSRPRIRRRAAHGRVTVCVWEQHSGRQ